MVGKQGRGQDGGRRSVDTRDKGGGRGEVHQGLTGEGGLSEKGWCNKGILHFLIVGGGGGRLQKIPQST